MKQIETISTWVALYWIIMLFTAFNAAAKSFVNESRGRLLYYYTLVSPGNFISAKMIYNSVVMTILSVVAIFLYSIFFQMRINDVVLFGYGILLGNIGIAFTLSLLSTIASKAGNNVTLLAILGLPILLPIILVTTTLTQNAINGLDWAVQWKYVFALFSLDLVCFLLSIVLFPYLWRE